MKKGLFYSRSFISVFLFIGHNFKRLKIDENNIFSSLDKIFELSFDPKSGSEESEKGREIISQKF